MIFQVPIDLEIEHKVVRAIIDIDTGLIGFTESIENQTIEYSEGPIEFKKALVNKLEPCFAKKSLTNFKVSGQNEKARFLNKYLTDM